MRAYEYFRKPRPFDPRTPFAALRAMEQGLSGPEAFIHLGASMRPLAMEPFDIPELSRILARERMDFPTTLCVMRILKKLSRDPDAERALFGSESITVIESRYSRRVAALMKAYKEKPRARLLYRLARLNYELAELNADSDFLSRFYLKKSFAFAARLIHGRGKRARKAEIGLAVKALMGLGLNEHALLLLKAHSPALGNAALPLHAMLAFGMGDYGRLRELLAYMASQGDMPHEMRREASYWIGEGSGA
jgi:hypothetical protein